MKIYVAIIPGWSFKMEIYPLLQDGVSGQNLIHYSRIEFLDEKLSILPGLRICSDQKSQFG
jgi:hypothetical protein